MASEATRKRVVTTRYWKELRRMLQDAGGIRAENQLDIQKLAEVAGTHPTTTRKLFDGTTMFPHYRTVWCNLAALGYSVSPVERKALPVADLQRLAEIGKRPKKRRGKKRKGKR
jgi:hypothetical protein